MKISVAWCLMWGFSYLMVVLVDPGVGGPPVWQDIVAFSVFGILLLAAAVLKAYVTKNKIVQQFSIGLLLVLAALSVYSGIASFTGAQLWVVPFANKEFFQVSMALMDLLGAVFMIDLALEKP